MLNRRVTLMSLPSLSTPTPPPRPPWIVAALLYTLVVGYLLVRDIGVPIYDDGYFFKRFALNALNHGMFAWNVEDGPVYGCTSQAFQLVATLCAMVSNTHYVVVVKVVSALSLIGLGALLLRFCTRVTELPHRGVMIVLLGLGSPLVLTTVLTGMETATMLLTLALVLVAMFEPDGRMRLSPFRAALLTVVIYLFRPDVALVPAVAYVLHGLVRGESISRYLAALALMMTLTLASLWGYYGTPFPLSFFMKTAGIQPYGPHMMELGLHDKSLHFGATVVFAAPLLWLAAYRRDPTNLALLGATAALWAYHLALTNEIMGYRGRFYVPGMVPLIMAAARSDEAYRRGTRRPLVLGGLAVFTIALVMGYLLRWLPTPGSDYLGQISWASYTGLGLGAAWLLWPRGRARPLVDLGVMGAIIIASVLLWKTPTSFRMRSDARLMRVHARQFTTVRGLFDVAHCLPDAANVYHSEMGVIGLVLYRTRVVDLVGILSDHILRGDTFENYCQRDQPEAIFLPHRNYRRLNAEIKASECFESYRRVVDRSASPLHIREDLADSFLQCARDVHRWRSR